MELVPHRRVPLKELQETLQCAADEPDINGEVGIIDYMKLVPVTRETVEAVCAWIDSGCNISDSRNVPGGNSYTPWSMCYKEAARLRSFSRENPDYAEDHMPGVYFNDVRRTHLFEPDYNIHLMRVMGGELAVDWPWAMERFKVRNRHPNHSILRFMAEVLRLVTAESMGDSVFLIGQEQSFLPYHIPFPAISNSPSLDHADIPWPWIESWNTEVALNQKLKHDRSTSPTTNKENINSNAAYSAAFCKNKDLPWEERIPKAAFFGNMVKPRRMFYIAAAQHPDLIEAAWLCKPCQEVAVSISNASSFHTDMTAGLMESSRNSKTTTASSASTSTSTAAPLPGSFEFIGGMLHQEFVPYNPCTYRYVVVLVSVLL